MKSIETNTSDVSVSMCQSAWHQNCEGCLVCVCPPPGYNRPGCLGVKNPSYLFVHAKLCLRETCLPEACQPKTLEKTQASWFSSAVLNVDCVLVCLLNPFTAKACKTFRAERCRDVPTNSVCSGPIIHLLSMLCVFMKLLLHAQCQKQQQQQNKQKTHFALLLVVFKRRHGSEAVK